MDPSVLINGNKEDDRSFKGHRWSVYRILYYMRWTSCLIGLVTGAVVTVYMTLSVMLIILPYIQMGSSGSGIWGDYSDWQWGPCSVTCGHGLQEGKRSRTCPGEAVCVGNETELLTRHCTSAHCKVDGQWTEWKADGPCSVTCGIGIQLLYRGCSNPAPENGGQQCEGGRIKQIECNQQACCPKNKEDTNFECNGGWIRNDDFGACYCFSLTKATWNKAQTLCKKQSAILSYVYSLKESDWISESCKKHLGSSSWIGGKRVKYRYQWIFETGTRTMNFTNWAPNEPVPYTNNNYICVQLWAAQQYKWDDFDCNQQQSFVCKSLL